MKSVFAQPNIFGGEGKPYRDTYSIISNTCFELHFIPKRIIGMENAYIFGFIFGFQIYNPRFITLNIYLWIMKLMKGNG